MPAQLIGTKARAARDPAVFFHGCSIHARRIPSLLLRDRLLGFTLAAAGGRMLAGVGTAFEQEAPGGSRGTPRSATSRSRW